MLTAQGRPSWDETFLAMAAVIAKRSACCKRQVGAVLVRENHVISVGYNGPPKGAPARDATTCVRIGVPSGEQPDKVCCTHAETNAVALAAYHGHATKGASLYVTTSPCAGCARVVINAGVVRVVYAEGYADADAAAVFAASGVEVVHLPALEPVFSFFDKGHGAMLSTPWASSPSFVISCPHPEADWLQVCSCPSQCACKGIGGMCL